VNLTEKDKEGLRRIIEYEDTADHERLSRWGWTWEKVSVWPATLNRLIQMRLLEVVSHTNSYRGMRLTEEGHAVVQNLLAKPHDILQAPQNQNLSLPDDLFEDIIGHGDVKELLKACLLAEKQCMFCWQDRQPWLKLFSCGTLRRQVVRGQSGWWARLPPRLGYGT